MHLQQYQTNEVSIGSRNNGGVVIPNQLACHVIAYNKGPFLGHTLTIQLGKGRASSKLLLRSTNDVKQQGLIVQTNTGGM